MKTNLLVALALLCTISTNGQHLSNCIFDNFLQEQLLWASPVPPDTLLTGTLTIRTVVHVLYNDPKNDISNDVIEQLIEDVNRRYRADNVDESRVHSSHKHLIADADIQFCLAKKDPQGGATCGITHTQINTDFFNVPHSSAGFREEMKYDSLGGKSAWNIDGYFNIWIAPVGDAQQAVNYGISYPGYQPAAIYLNGGIPGVVFDISNFNSEGDKLSASIEGVLAHECGHVLGLLHTWGPKTDQLYWCRVDDEIEDTPNCRPLFGCDELTFGANTCSSNIQDSVDNVSNMMAYGCMLMFTPGQVAAMRTNLSNFTPSIVMEGECESFSENLLEQRLCQGEIIVYPNPNAGIFNILIDHSNELKEGIQIFNSIGEVIQFRYTKSDRAIHLFLSDVPVGLYLIYLNTHEGMIVKKVMIE